MQRDLIFKQIVDIIKKDYAGAAEVASGTETMMYQAALGRAWHDRFLDDMLFYRYMCEYFASLGDRSLRFDGVQDDELKFTRCGFHVRRDAEGLWVTETSDEKRFVPGDLILTINKSVPEKHLEYMIGNVVMADEFERQRWDGVVQMARHAKVRHADGSEEDLAIASYPLQNVQLHDELEVLPDGTVYLTVREFNDGSCSRLLAAHAAEVSRTRKVVIDVRRVRGGDEDNIFPLLDVAFPGPVTASDLLGSQKVYTNYSEGNCARRIAQLQLFERGASPDDRAWAEDCIRDLASKSGSGLVLEDAPFDANRRFGGACAADVSAACEKRKVVVVTDTWCEDAAEKFVQIARLSPLVTTLGRATQGTLDYGNPMSVAFDETFSMRYPMSKSEAAQKGEGMKGKGIAPDVYIPWTPAECTEDVLRARALAL